MIYMESELSFVPTDFYGFARDFLWIHVDLSISSGDLLMVFWGLVWTYQFVLGIDMVF